MVEASSRRVEVEGSSFEDTVVDRSVTVGIVVEVVWLVVPGRDTCKVPVASCASFYASIYTNYTFSHHLIMCNSLKLAFW